MSQENVEVVRQPFAVKARSRRGVEERIYLRFPSVVAFVTRAVWRLPPRSWPRRALLLRVAQLASMRSIAEISRRASWSSTQTSSS